MGASLCTRSAFPDAHSTCCCCGATLSNRELCKACKLRDPTDSRGVEPNLWQILGHAWIRCWIGVVFEDTHKS